jgi:hypothetical protein
LVSGLKGWVKQASPIKGELGEGQLLFVADPTQVIKERVAPDDFLEFIWLPLGVFLGSWVHPKHGLVDEAAQLARCWNLSGVSGFEVTADLALC